MVSIAADINKPLELKVYVLTCSKQPNNFLGRFYFPTVGPLITILNHFGSTSNGKVIGSLEQTTEWPRR